MGHDQFSICISRIRSNYSSIILFLTTAAYKILLFFFKLPDHFLCTHWHLTSILVCYMIIELYMHEFNFSNQTAKVLRTGIKYCFPRPLAKSDANEKSLGNERQLPWEESQGNKEHLYADPLPNVQASWPKTTDKYKSFTYSLHLQNLMGFILSYHSITMKPQ